MRHFPRDAIWPWVETDPEARAPYLASMAPKDFNPETWNDGLILPKSCAGSGLAIECRAPCPANFFTEGWSGSASMHYTEQMEMLKKLKTDESDPNALRWLNNNTLASIERNIEQAEIEEESRALLKSRPAAAEKFYTTPGD